ncbi:MAG: Zn-dependent hydrolase [Rhodospirillaceae bacterium]|nr:Zn-dependent hydrolase [Rhodospirillaceae bacterium]MDD9999216.1 Zn-dependent hydrolase [Rhodospirillaceae bacterium]MDE0362192.1 Zn-dependent hydrolase [Rhodospirillaceae bacterium]
MQGIRISRERLWDSHMEMAKIGALPRGGSCRLALDEDDKKGRDLFVSWCRQAGCDVRFDRIGNIYATRSGSDNSLPPAATGSHLDTQPHGGRFDGVYGVLAGLEVIRTLNDHGVETHAPVEVVVWTNEEGARMSPPLLGSQVFVGRVPIEEAHNIRTTDGTRVLADLKAIGYFGEEITSHNHKFACFIECHIEQGPILQESGRQIGAVTMVQGASASRVRVTGLDNHAGTTPLTMRKDALVGAARMVTSLNEIGLSSDEAARVTVGRFDVKPNSTSTIPGEVVFHIDLRHPDRETLIHLDRKFRNAISSIASEHGLTVEHEPIMTVCPVAFDEQVVRVVEDVTRGLGFKYQRMISGAGHDAMYIASVAPTGMIFVPCEDGISHNEAESASPDDLAAGANVLLHALLRFCAVSP